MIIWKSQFKNTMLPFDKNSRDEIFSAWPSGQHSLCSLNKEKVREKGRNMYLIIIDIEKNNHKSRNQKITTGVKTNDQINVHSNQKLVLGGEQLLSFPEEKVWHK